MSTFCPLPPAPSLPASLSERDRGIFPLDYPATITVAAVEQIVAQLGQETDFNTCCWKIRLLLQYLDSFPPDKGELSNNQLPSQLVDITELAVMTYLNSGRPGEAWNASQRHNCLTIMELLAGVDRYVERQNDYVLQLRLATLMTMLYSEDQTLIISSSCVTSSASSFSALNHTLPPAAAPYRVHWPSYILESLASPKQAHSAVHATPLNFPSPFSHSILTDYDLTIAPFDDSEARHSVLTDRPYTNPETAHTPSIAPGAKRLPPLNPRDSADHSEIPNMDSEQGELFIDLFLSLFDSFTPSVNSLDQILEMLPVDGAWAELPVSFPTDLIDGAILSPPTNRSSSLANNDPVQSLPTCDSLELPHPSETSSTDSGLSAKAKVNPGGGSSPPSLTPATSWSSSLDSHDFTHSLPTTPVATPPQSPIDTAPTSTSPSPPSFKHTYWTEAITTKNHLPPAKTAEIVPAKRKWRDDRISFVVAPVKQKKRKEDIFEHGMLGSSSGIIQDKENIPS